MAIWSTNALAAGVALDHSTLLQVLALQFSGAALVLGVMSRAGSPKRSARLDSRSIRVALVGLTAAICLQYLAFATAPLVAANAIAYAWPLFVALASLLRSRDGGGSCAALLAALGFAGVVLVFAGRGGGGETGSAPALGYLAALGSAAAMAYYTLGVTSARASGTQILLLATLTGAAACCGAALIEGAALGPPGAVALGLYTGVGPMAAGYGLWTLAMMRPAGVRVAPLAFLTPLASTLLLLATGESLSAVGLVGCALIIVCAAGVLARRAGPTSAAARAGGP